MFDFVPLIVLGKVGQFWW